MCWQREFWSKHCCSLWAWPTHVQPPLRSEKFALLSENNPPKTTSILRWKFPAGQRKENATSTFIACSAMEIGTGCGNKESQTRTFWRSWWQTCLEESKRWTLYKTWQCGKVFYVGINWQLTIYSSYGVQFSTLMRKVKLYGKRTVGGMGKNWKKHLQFFRQSLVASLFPSFGTGRVCVVGCKYILCSIGLSPQTSKTV